MGMTMETGRFPRFYLGPGDSETSFLATIVTTLLDHKYGLALSHLPCLSYIKMLHFPKLVVPTVPRIAAHSIHGDLPQLTAELVG